MTTWSAAMREAHVEQGVIAEDHFATSIDHSDAIARLVLARALATAERHRLSDPWIVDIGAGRGRLLEQLLDLGFPGDRLLGVDVRPAPDLPVQWIQGVAPGCLPQVSGLVLAHEFLDDVPADVIRDGRVEHVDGSLGEPASPEQLAWCARWGEGVCGLSRDEVWAAIVASVEVGEAIAVDYSGGGPVGHRRGRRGVWGADISTGVNFASLRTRTGGTVVPQHRMLAGEPVVAERGGLGSFLWLITDVTNG